MLLRCAIPWYRSVHFMQLSQRSCNMLAISTVWIQGLFYYIHNSYVPINKPITMANPAI